MTADTALVGFEWAGNRVQAWAFDADGEILSEFVISCEAQAAKMSPARFAYDHLLPGLGNPTGVPIIGCGDLASPGLPGRPQALRVPLPLSELAEKLHPFDGLHIVPWLWLESPPDYSCGSEAQLAALEDLHGSICCVSRKARHFKLQHGRIASFSTAMIPDLFAYLAKAEVLEGVIIQDGVVPEGDVFNEWVERALDSDGTASAFPVYAALLAGHISEDNGKAALLGLLVGSDIAAHYDPGDEVTLIADGHWLEAYMQAFGLLGADVEAIPADEAIQDGLFELADMAGLLTHG